MDEGFVRVASKSFWSPRLTAVRLRNSAPPLVLESANSLFDTLVALLCSDEGISCAIANIANREPLLTLGSVEEPAHELTLGSVEEPCELSSRSLLGSVASHDGLRARLMKEPCELARLTKEPCELSSR